MFTFLRKAMHSNSDLKQFEENVLTQWIETVIAVNYPKAADFVQYQIPL